MNAGEDYFAGLKRGGGYSNLTWMVWIDYNGDPDFDDPGENIVNSGTVNGDFNTTITIPQDAYGNKRMRVSLRRNLPAISPGPCGYYTQGEVEDYTVHIEPPCSEPTGYSSTGGNSTNPGWINQVSFDSGFATGNNNGYTNLSKTFELVPGSSNTVGLNPVFFDSPSDQYWNIWIDYDQDGDFENDEMVFSSSNPESVAISGTITPPDWASGCTRMRIKMHYYGNQSSSCGDFTFGEVEDYIIGFITDSSNNLTEGIEGTSILRAKEENNILVFPNPTGSNLTVQTNESIEEILVYNIKGKLVKREFVSTFSVNDLSQGIYFLSIKTASGIKKSRFVKI